MPQVCVCLFFVPRRVRCLRHKMMPELGFMPQVCGLTCAPRITYDSLTHGCNAEQLCLCAGLVLHCWCASTCRLPKPVVLLSRCVGAVQ
jgi:hypothetical protein